MKKILKKIAFHLSDRILSYAEQHRNEVRLKEFNLDTTISINNVSIEGNIHIGKYTYVNEKSRIDSGPNAKITIGKHCAIGRNVHITAKTHNLKQPTSIEDNPIIPHLEEDVIIGNYIWIGDNVIILPGIIIEDYAVIGANSVITKNVQQFEIVGGVPAKHIRFNTSHLLYKTNNS